MTTKAANTGSGYPSGMKNRIINGGMDIAQRGTSFTGWTPTNSTYALDRFRITSASTAAVITVTQNSDVPSTNEFQNSLRVAVTTADTSIAAGDVLVIDQYIEGYNIRDLIGRTFTLSFWVRSSKTGVHCVDFSNAAADRSYIAEYNITVVDTWQFKTITVVGGCITAGTWNYTTGVGLMVRFALAGGTTFQGAANSWTTGALTNTSNQVNCLDTIGNIFAITGVQLELGAVATPFEHRPYGTELALCQRYCYVLGNGYIGSGGAVTAIIGYANVQFPVSMRIAPSSISGTSVTTPTQIIISGASANAASAVVLWGASTCGATLQCSLSGATISPAVCYTNSGQIIFNGAEL